MLSIQLRHFSSAHHPGPTVTVLVSPDVHTANSYSSYFPADCSTPDCIPGTQPVLPRDNSIASPLKKQATITLCTRNLLLTAAAEVSNLASSAALVSTRASVKPRTSLPDHLSAVDECLHTRT